MSGIVEQFELCEDTGDEFRADRAFAGLMWRAVSLRASDLYFAWNENDVTISVRHLGILKWLSNVSREEGRRYINHVKAFAGMDLAQKFRPLDGRCAFEVQRGKRVDLRINTIPTLYGEDMSIRLLDRDFELLDLENLGLDRKSLHELTTLLGEPGGLILVTGPAGAGKTTTLYACLHHLNDGTRKINTIEDPIEYALDGIRQSQVNLKVGLGFPDLLRSVLRQSPDVIMVGEIRDPVTAETAVRAANSGHLVFATLHAPIAAGVVDSMLAFGVAPHFLASSLLGVLSQRLVRILCDHCKLACDVSGAPLTFAAVKPWLEPSEGHTIYGATGCERCRGEGYTRLTGVFEVLRVTKEIRQRIFDRRPVRQIHEKAVEQGMIDLRRAALLKVAKGITSTRELVRTIPADHLMPDHGQELPSLSSVGPVD